MKRKKYSKRVFTIIAMSALCIGVFGKVQHAMSYEVKPFDKKKVLESLKEEQRKVTQQEGTEAPFKNEYWDHKEEGIYVDVVSGEPLFSSTHKFDSGSGWPSFWDVIDKTYIQKKEDRKLFLIKRIEVRSSKADSHLGHLFDDGPKEKTGLRYCINSAALKFIPKKDMKEKGYGEYLSLFENPKAIQNKKKQGPKSPTT